MVFRDDAQGEQAVALQAWQASQQPEETEREQATVQPFEQTVDVRQGDGEPDRAPVPVLGEEHALRLDDRFHITRHGAYLGLRHR